MSRSADHHPVRRSAAPGERPVARTRRGNPADGAPGAREPHVCPACASALVAPVAWDEAGPDHWAVTLRCPECEWLGESVFSEELVARFDELLDDATETIVRDLQRLTRANMEDEIDRFLVALRADQIWPMDF